MRAEFSIYFHYFAHTHSKVKITNNYLRVAMSPDRMEDLVQISSKRDLANNIELSKFVEIFKLAKPVSFLSK